MTYMSEIIYGNVGVADLENLSVLRQHGTFKAFLHE